MTTQEPTHITRALETFFEELKTYRGFRILEYKNKITRKQTDELYVLREKLLNDMGRLRGRITELMGKDRITVTPQKGQEYSYDMWFRAFGVKFDAHAVRALNICIDVTKAAIGKLKSDIENGIRDEQGNLIEKPPIIDTEPPKAFIAHGGMSGVLNKLNEFIEALGIKPIIVELSASKGMSVDDKVNKYTKDADCGIVLATRGGIVDEKTAKKHPRLNVIDELERLRAAFPDKTILLLEKGVDLPSNISGLTYEPFVRQSMDRAFTAIARELTAFGILKATKPPSRE